MESMAQKYIKKNNKEIKLSNTGIEIKAGKYYGIFDDGGLEGILPYKGKESEYNITASKIRSMANGHRNARTFVCVLDKKEAEEIFDAVDRSKWHLAKRRLQKVIKLEVF